MIQNFPASFDKLFNTFIAGLFNHKSFSMAFRISRYYTSKLSIRSYKVDSKVSGVFMDYFINLNSWHYYSIFKVFPVLSVVYKYMQTKSSTKGYDLQPSIRVSFVGH